MSFWGNIPKVYFIRTTVPIYFIFFHISKLKKVIISKLYDNIKIELNIIVQ